MSGPSNKGLHQTKGAEVWPSPFAEGQSLRAPFAGEARCSAGAGPAL